MDRVHTLRKRQAIRACCVLLVFAFSSSLSPSQAETPPTNSRVARRPAVEILGEASWRKVEHSVEKGLDYLAGQQRPDGSFDAPPTGQPGITSLCVMAFLSRGHLPEQGPYGRRLTKAIDFVLACQQKDGLLSYVEPEPQHVHDGASHAGNYNHAIAGLMLGEVYGMCRGDQHDRIRKAIERGIVFLRSQQLKPKRQAVDKGGVRYIRPRTTIDADLSVTSWQLMFMRSARNAEFNVPKEYVDDAMQFVRGCFDTRIKTFIYGHSARDHMPTWGVAGGGIISLELGGDHGTEMARSAGTWLLAQSYDRYNRGGNGPYHYGLYYASQGMFQLGGEYWDSFYPRLADALTKFQQDDGSWDIEQDFNGNGFGQTYTTALSVLALTPPYQLLPIYQR